jgi:purine-binding chemotaxis protein CheW
MQKYHLVDEKFMTFSLNQEEYAVSMDKVLEILGTEGILDSDHADSCVRGIIHSRNHIVQVFDIRCLFGLETRTKKEGSSVLVTVFGPGLTRIGLMVDAIRQVVPIMAGFSEKPPAGVDNPRDKFVLGQVEIEGRTIQLLNLDKWEQYLPSVSPA